MTFNSISVTTRNALLRIPRVWRGTAQILTAWRRSCKFRRPLAILPAAGTTLLSGPSPKSSPAGCLLGGKLQGLRGASSSAMDLLNWTVNRVAVVHTARKSATGSARNTARALLVKKGGRI